MPAPARRRRSLTKSLLAQIQLLTLFLALSLGARHAVAHSPPQIDDIVWAPDGHQVLVTNRGLIQQVLSDGSWRLLCGSALDIEADDRFHIVATRNGHLLAATRNGLFQTADGGCSWKPIAGMNGVFATSLAQASSNRDQLFVSLSGAGKSQVSRSDDGGAVWRKVMDVSDYDVILRLAIAPSEPTRVYASGYYIDASSSARIHLLHRSSDGGATWEALGVELGDAERLELESVHPHDPDRLLLLAINDDATNGVDRALVSRDGGATFTPLVASVGLSDAAFDETGAIWVAGDEALWRGDANATVLTPLGETVLMTCVTEHEGAIYACGHHSGFAPTEAGLGVAMDAGQSFAPVMRFTDVVHALDCPATTPANAACESSWYHWQLEILVELGGAPVSTIGPPPAPQSLDGGAARPNAPGVAGSPTTDGGSAPAPSSVDGVGRSDGSGCSVAPTSNGTRCWLPFLVALCASVRRRIRRPLRIETTARDGFARRSCSVCPLS